MRIPRRLRTLAAAFLFASGSLALSPTAQAADLVSAQQSTSAAQVPAAASAEVTAAEAMAPAAAAAPTAAASHENPATPASPANSTAETAATGTQLAVPSASPVAQPTQAANPEPSTERPQPAQPGATGRLAPVAAPTMTGAAAQSQETSPATAEPEGQAEASDTAYGAPTAETNYHWKNDVASQVMAQHVGPVLHRVGGSWFNAPDIPQESRDLAAKGTALVGPGTPIFVGEKMCTLAVTGYDAAGRKVGITAGHCGNFGEQVYSADAPGVGVAGVIAQSVPGDDYGVIIFNDHAQVTRSYNGVTVNSLGGSAAFGQQLCKQGVATGFTCGPSLDERNAQVCAMIGDSGAPMLAGDRLTGVVVGGNPIWADGQCRTPWQGPIHTPTISAPIDRVLAQLNEAGGPGAGFALP